MKTIKLRLKNKNINALRKMAGSVNYCWNFANATSFEYLQKFDKWLTGYDLDALSSGCAKSLGLNSQTIQLVNHEYATRRKQFKKRKLSWRTHKRSLGWIPAKGTTIKVKDDTIIFNKYTFRFWKSQLIPGQVKAASFIEDSKGNWYVCLNCETSAKERKQTGEEVGIDLGLKTLATLSNGEVFSRENITTKYANKLSIAQRARKRKLVKSIQAKIKNSRSDWNHKASTQIVKEYDKIIVGDVSSSKLKKTRFAKSVSDAGWHDFKSMLKYKAIALGVEYKEVNENFSTVTCSVCFERTGPSGLSALGVREWTCSCGATHNRDVNAAKNILRFGHESPKGALQKEVPLLKD